MEGNDTPRLELSSERLSLFDEIDRRGKRIAQIYIGIHLALRNGANPERFHCAAHEARELMEKMSEIVDIRTQPGPAPISERARDLVNNYDIAMAKTPLTPPTWTGEVDEHMAGLLEKLRTFVEWLKALPARRDEFLSAVRALDGPGRLPPDLEEDMYREWKKTKGFFDGLAHHQFEPASEEFEEHLSRLEAFLSAKLNPRTFANFDAIDAIIAEGKVDDKR